MIDYILKSAACLLLLLGIYHLFLEREKMHRFNRFFLIFSLVFGLTIPLFTIDIGSPADFSQQIDELNSRLTAEPPATITYAPNPESTPDVSSPKSQTSPFESAVPWLLLFYLLVSSMLAVRLLRNLYAIWSKVKTNPHIPWQNASLVLIDDGSVPHSFFNYIFVNRQLYNSGDINQAVLRHELTHVRQKHSVDILFVELLKIALWFNPLLYFYKKAIQTNHEFLADEAVITDTDNVQGYQKLLLKMQSGDPELQLASSIKFSVTKKRIIMMTKNTSRFRMICKQLALLPILAGLIFAFSTRTVRAQNVDRMSLTELIDAVNQRLESTESLTAAEQEKLRVLMSKMQEKFMPKPPEPKEPGPPTKLKKERELQLLKSRLKSLKLVYKKYSDEYMKIKPTQNNKEKMEVAYQKLLEIKKRIDKVNDKIWKTDTPAPPIPSPPKPEVRIKADSIKSIPPSKPSVPAPAQKIKAQNLLDIVIDSAGQIEVDGEPTAVDEIKASIKGFLKNHRNDSESSTRAAIGIKTLEETPENVTETMVNVINQAYKEVRNEAAQTEYGVNYLELDQNKRAKIRQIYPNNIIVREGNSFH